MNQLDELVAKASYDTTSVYGFGHPLYYDNVIATLRITPATFLAETAVGFALGLAGALIIAGAGLFGVLSFLAVIRPDIKVSVMFIPYPFDLDKVIMSTTDSWSDSITAGGWSYRNTNIAANPSGGWGHTSRWFLIELTGTESPAPLVVSGG
ncbi:MAG: hypothetical protein HC794_09655 [Nitrospiraceae bacterium]|nr:hypothetical protein [Nitrospiraceae bacterium]